MEKPGGGAHRIYQGASPTQGILHSGSFRRNLAEVQHEQRDEDSSNQFTIVWNETKRQHSSHTGSDNYSYAINDQDGREENIGLRNQAFNLEGLFIAFSHQIFELNAADRGKRGFSSRCCGTEN